MNTDRFTDWDSSGFFAEDDPLTKSTPSMADVHTPTSVPLARRKKKMKPKTGEVEVTMALEKIEDDQRMAWGWASVTTRNGQPLEDLQGDVIETEELQKAVHEFVRKKRIMGEMHTVIGTGDIVDSIVFTDDIQKALGIDLGKEGWFVGVHVTSDSTWARVKKGELRGFSLGGFGVRELMKSRGGHEVVELDVEDFSKRLDFLEALEARLDKTARRPAGSPGGTGGQFTGGPAGFGNSGVARGGRKKGKPADTPASLKNDLRLTRSAMHFSARVGDSKNLDAQRSRARDIIARHRALVPKKPKVKQDPWKERQDEHDTWRDEARFRTQTGYHRGFRPGLPRS